jgi:hypothetical protein
LLSIKKWTYGFLGDATLNSEIENFPSFVRRNNFYRILESFDLKVRLDSVRQHSSPDFWSEFSSRNPEIINIYNSTEIDDNPILMIYGLKENNNATN